MDRFGLLDSVIKQLKFPSLQNGQQFGFFKDSRGTRQSNSISLQISTPASEAPSRVIDNLILKGSLACRIVRTDITISHLLFAHEI